MTSRTDSSSSTIRIRGGTGGIASTARIVGGAGPTKEQGRHSSYRIRNDGLVTRRSGMTQGERPQIHQRFLAKHRFAHDPRGDGRQ